MPEYVERREFDHPRVPVPPLPVDVGPRLLTLLEHTNLTRFFCDRLLVGKAVFSLLSKIIKHSPELQELHIRICYSTTHIRSLNSNVLNPNRLTMFNLRSVSLDLSRYPDRNKTPSLYPEIVDFLIQSCPSIVDLRLLTFRLRLKCNISRFLLHGNWPKLARLTLRGAGFYSEGLSDPEKTLIMHQFLARHPTIKCLSIGEGDWVIQDCITEDSLPIMQSLYLLRILLPDLMAENIRHLSGEVVPASLPVIRLMTSLQSCVVTRQLDLPYSDLLDALPFSVERIDLKFDGLYDDSYDENRDTQDDFMLYVPMVDSEWESILEHLENLTHIGSAFTTVDVKTRAGMKMMLKLCSVLPGLLYVQVATGWIMMEGIREESREYGLSSGTSIDSARWGDIFNGIGLVKDDKIILL
ncbi:hypothetical protein M422DRAFT_269339 [Sphaerobolus stellatus SS14]|uniref:F-box domain-containing protein n=1 Tax=Sphaerobolus stellatus (strain SS14) TaxID=990650 RepID=A0A0C9UVC3_SPHS4|nr:hypothetical protein M422DRAFT_269339 [Sphaerobolus stellatus SS14]